MKTVVRINTHDYEINKQVITLEELKILAKLFPNMTISQLMELLTIAPIKHNDFIKLLKVLGGEN